MRRARIRIETQPLKDHCRGLLLPGERKPAEPMAAHPHPNRVEAARQPMHHLVAKASWRDKALLAAVERQASPRGRRPPSPWGS